MVLLLPRWPLFQDGNSLNDTLQGHRKHMSQSALACEAGPVPFRAMLSLVELAATLAASLRLWHY